MNNDKKVNEDKELKKLLDSYLAVAKHKLGRTPSLEELQSMLAEEKGSSAPDNAGYAQPEQLPQGMEQMHKETETQPQDVAKEPKILRTLIYYGMESDKDGQRKPNPNKILFYEDPQENKVYDCNDGKWLDSRPSVLDHLQSRPVEFNERDIVSAIAHGIVDDEDYESLDKAGMITDTPKQLWAKFKDLSEKMSTLKELKKSEDPLEDGFEPESEQLDEESAEPVDSDYTAGMEAEGLEEGQGLSFASDEMPGDDVLSEMMEAAMSDYGLSPQMENSIRALIRDEISNMSRHSYDDQDSEDIDIV